MDCFTSKQTKYDSWRKGIWTLDAKSYEALGISQKILITHIYIYDDKLARDNSKGLFFRKVPYVIKKIKNKKIRNKKIIKKRKRKKSNKPLHFVWEFKGTEEERIRGKGQQE